MGKTYAFSEVTLTLSHPSLGTISTNGMGLGQVTVNMRSDRSSVTVAQDGTVVTNKIKDESGQLTLQILQNSSAHRTLKQWWTYLVQAPASEWADIKAVITSKSTGEQSICNSGAMVKLPDDQYGNEAQLIDWTFLFQYIDRNLV